MPVRDAVSQVVKKARGQNASPTGIGRSALGMVEDPHTLELLGRAVAGSVENDHIVLFSFTHGGDGAPWELRLSGASRLSPALLMEALAMGAKGVTVAGPGNEGVVESCRRMLAAIDINPARISHVEGSTGDLSNLNPFKKNIGRMPATRSSLGRCLNAVQVLMAQPDHVPPIRSRGIALLGYGCLAMSEPTFSAYGIQDANVMDSINRLMTWAGIGCETARGIHISGTSLRDWGMRDLFDSYSGSVERMIRESRAPVLYMPTPKSYITFKNMALPCKVESLVSVLKTGLTGEFQETDDVIAYHPSCAGGGDFDADCLGILQMIPGLRQIALEGGCGDSGWRDITLESVEKARQILGRAETAGAGTIVAGSTRCAAHLRAASATHSTDRVKVFDIYTYLASKLRGVPP